MEQNLKQLFETWGQTAKTDYVQSQWLLSKWEVVEGVVWPKEKISVMVETIKTGLDLSSKDILVDLGCGGGWILKELAPTSKKVFGLDFSYSMLEKAKAFTPNENFVNGEIGKLPFQDASVDRALSYFVFLNFMDDRFVEQALLDVYRILKKGGQALIGQLPDKNKSKDYDAAKSEYIKYCEKTFKLGKSHRDVCRAPQKLFDREKLESFLKKNKIAYEFKKSFNPFYRAKEEKTVEWRFDLILRK